MKFVSGFLHASRGDAPRTRATKYGVASRLVIGVVAGNFAPRPSFQHTERHLLSVAGLNPRENVLLRDVGSAANYIY